MIKVMDGLWQGDFTVVKKRIAKSVLADPCILLSIGMQGPGPMLLSHIDEGKARLDISFNKMVDKLCESNVDLSDILVKASGSTDIRAQASADSILDGLRKAFLRKGIRLKSSQITKDMQPYTRHVAVDPLKGKTFNLVDIISDDKSRREYSCRNIGNLQNQNLIFVPENKLFMLD